MNKLLKTIDQVIDEKLLCTLAGKIIHATINKHPSGHGGEDVNVWFAGEVAGFDKVVLFYDHTKELKLDFPIVRYNLILTDGMAYGLSSTECQIEEMTQQQLQDLIEEVQAAQLAKESILLPGKDF